METPSKKGLKWSAEAERDLYAACLVAVGEPKGNTLRQAVKILEENLGVVVTVKAASHRVQHLQKLKRKEGTTGTPDGGSTKKKTPAPRGKKRGKAVADDDDDDEDAEATPSKKVAKAKKAAPYFPVDNDQEELKPVKNEHYYEDSDIHDV